MNLEHHQTWWSFEQAIEHYLEQRQAFYMGLPTDGITHQAQQEDARGFRYLMDDWIHEGVLNTQERANTVFIRREQFLAALSGLAGAAETREADVSEQSSLDDASDEPTASRERDRSEDRIGKREAQTILSIYDTFKKAFPKLLFEEVELDRSSRRELYLALGQRVAAVAVSAQRYHHEDNPSSPNIKAIGSRLRDVRQDVEGELPLGWSKASVHKHVARARDACTTHP
jgi:hypothetical protein